MTDPPKPPAPQPQLPESYLLDCADATGRNVEDISNADYFEWAEMLDREYWDGQR